MELAFEGGQAGSDGHQAVSMSGDPLPAAARSSTGSNSLQVLAAKLTDRGD
jgi:hypothetical protein